MKLSVLDQVPVSSGETHEEALEHTLELAKWTEQLGFHRYWVAEHHNTIGLASTSPEILMTRIASVTNRVRIGSGGILLPQYSPYKIAENAKTMEAFFPGRIDIGVGRSPGGSPITRKALMDHLYKNLDEFPRQLADLQGFLHNSLPRDHEFRLVKAGPRIEKVPPLWVLGLSERGARNAAELGLGFVFGHFINPENGIAAMCTYREHFSPSETMENPQSFVCIFVVCAETEGEAEALALSQDKWLLNVGKGAGTVVQSPDQVWKKPFNKDELKTIRHNRKRAIVGTPDTVRQKLLQLQDEYQTDEFMIITNIHDFKAKKKSYELVAEAIL
jgi:luciferase family oxidoreductase group 1